MGNERKDIIMKRERKKGKKGRKKNGRGRLQKKNRAKEGLLERGKEENKDRNN